MRRGVIILGIISMAALGLALFRYAGLSRDESNYRPSENISVQPQNDNTGVKTAEAPVLIALKAPIDQAKERVLKKPFGIYINPQNSPVSPERFQGYHTGTDFEIFPDEQDKDISVSAICDGRIIDRTRASGYGGVLVESCNLNGDPITVVYGHLKLESIKKKVGDTLDTGEKIGLLGESYSQETDGERKHLHLGVHKGTRVDIRGYVGYQSELSGWIDPLSLF